MIKAEVHSGQCLQDTSIREMGSLEGIFEQALLNGFSITEDLSEVREIFTPEKVISAAIVRYYTNKRVRTATGKMSDSLSNQKLFENGLFENGLFE